MNNRYKNGEFVYLVTDPEQYRRMVTAIKFTLDGGLIYDITLGTFTSSHYESEMSDTVNESLKMGLDERE
jgi:hypothetical protein